MSYQYDRKRIYEYGRGTQAKFEIRGSLIHEYGRATQAVYEIKGNLIHEYARGTQAQYEIRGNLIHEYAKGTQAVDENFCDKPILLSRVDYTGRVAVKA